MRIRRFIPVLAVALAPSLAHAQPELPPRPAGAEQVTDAEITLGLQLVQLMNMQAAAEAGVQVALDQQMQTAGMEEVREVLKDWVTEIFSAPESHQAFARIYAESFTEAELRGLVAFYQTPVGQRMAAEQGTLAIRGAEVGRELAEARQADLMQRLQAVLEKKPD
jgi:uncharacterized protein